MRGSSRGTLIIQSPTLSGNLYLLVVELPARPEKDSSACKSRRDWVFDIPLYCRPGLPIQIE